MTHDQVARDIAQSALNAIQTHEKICEQRATLAAEQRGNMVESMQRMESAGRLYAAAIKKQVDGLYSRFWIIAMSVIGGLFTIIILLTSLLLSGKVHT